MRKKQKLRITAIIFYIVALICIAVFLINMFSTGDANFLELLGAFVFSCMACSIWYTSTRMI